MGSTYLFFVEAKINGEWHCINAKYPEWKEDWKNYEVKNEFEYKLKESYWNGSRSYFGHAYDKLRDLGRQTDFSSLSPELKERFKSLVEDEESGEQTWVYPIEIEWNTLSTFINDDEYDSHGLIHKDTLFKYEKGDIDELWALEDEEASKLSEKQLEAYVYYEWDDCFGFSRGVKTVKNRAWETIREFRDTNILAKDAEIRIIGMEF